MAREALTLGGRTIVLVDRELRVVAGIAVMLEGRLGGPIDIGAALAGCGRHILRARPSAA